MPRPKHVPDSDLALPAALETGRPKGDQLREILENVAAELGPGRLMPSERFLAEHFAISRGTVRQEISRLVADGVLFRQHGSATFTADPPTGQLSMLTSFSEDIRARGRVPRAKLLRAAVELAGPRIAGQLALPPGAAIFRLERLRLVDDEPLAVERTNLSVDRFPGIDALDWSARSLYQTMEENWGVRPGWSDTSITAVLPDREDSDLLGIEPGQPCLASTGRLHDTTGQVVEVGRSLYRADKYNVFIQLRRTTPER
jgi:GntR family transcriptional regulator